MTSHRRASRVRRLTAYDQHCLRVETPARPLQIGMLATLDGRALVDPAGRLRLADIRRAINAGCLAVTVRADADQFPDLAPLAAAMERDRATLTGRG